MLKVYPPPGEFKTYEYVTKLSQATRWKTAQIEPNKQPGEAFLILKMLRRIPKKAGNK